MRMKKGRIVNQIAQAKQSHIREKELNSRLETTANEKANTFKDHILAVYQTYKAKGWLVDIGDLIYDWISKE